MRAYFFILIAMLILGCSTDKRIDIRDGESHEYKFKWYKSGRIGGGTEKIIYDVIVSFEDQLMVFSQQHPNGFIVKYYIDFDGRKKSYEVRASDTTWMKLTQSLILKNGTTVARFLTNPTPNCMELENDSLYCSTALFFTKEFGLISDINRELISIDRKKHPIQDILEEIKRDTDFYSKQ